MGLGIAALKVGGWWCIGAGIDLEEHPPMLTSFFFFLDRRIRASSLKCRFEDSTVYYFAVAIFLNGADITDVSSATR